MAATRRELLTGLGAGLVAMQGGALAADGEAIAAARRRWATVGDIERLEREIRDMNQRMQNALSRVRRSGFGPSALFIASVVTDASGSEYMGVDTSQSEFMLPFPGSLIALSVIAEVTYSGAAGSNYHDFEVHLDGVASGFSVQIAGGSRSAHDTAVKGDYTFSAGTIMQVYQSLTGTPTPTNNPHTATVWVSFT